MNDCVLAEQNNLAGRTDEPLPVRALTSSLSLVDRKLLHGAVDRVRDTNEVVRGERNRAGIHEGVPQVVQKIGRVLDADTEADQIFGKTALSASGRVDRSVANFVDAVSRSTSPKDGDILILTT